MQTKALEKAYDAALASAKLAMEGIAADLTSGKSVAFLQQKRAGDECPAFFFLICDEACVARCALPFFFALLEHKRSLRASDFSCVLVYLEEGSMCK